MPKSVLSEARFHDEQAAYAWVDARVWPQGPVCPKCGGMDRISKMNGASTRVGAYNCYACREQLGVDNTGETFEKGFAKIVPPRRLNRPV